MTRLRLVLVGFGLLFGCAVDSGPSKAAPGKPEPAPAKANVAQAKINAAAEVKAEPPAAEPPAEAAPAQAAPEAAPAEAAAEPTPAPAEGVGGGAGPQAPDSATAQRFRDPPWYRKTLFPDATVSKVGRSEANAEGLFQSHILFELPQGSSTEDCAKHLETEVGQTVTNLQRSVEADGRVKIAGSTDRYTVTCLCGEAKGTIRAYVAFEWTS